MWEARAAQAAATAGRMQARPDGVGAGSAGSRRAAEARRRAAEREVERGEGERALLVLLRHNLESVRMLIDRVNRREKLKRQTVKARREALPVQLAAPAEAAAELEAAAAGRAAAEELIDAGIAAAAGVMPPPLPLRAAHLVQQQQQQQQALAGEAAAVTADGASQQQQQQQPTAPHPALAAAGLHAAPAMPRGLGGPAAGLAAEMAAAAAAAGGLPLGGAMAGCPALPRVPNMLLPQAPAMCGGSVGIALAPAPLAPLGQHAASGAATPQVAAPATALASPAAPQALTGSGRPQRSKSAAAVAAAAAAAGAGSNKRRRAR